MCLFKPDHLNIPINQDIFSLGKSTPSFRAFGRNDHNSLHVVYVKGGCEETMFVLKIKTLFQKVLKM